MNGNFFVRCPACDDEHVSDEVDTLNIEEDIQGRDVVTFRCDYSNTIQQSLIFGG
jgi:hypothetical protein